MSPRHAHEPLSAQTRIFRRSVAVFTATLIFFALAVAVALIVRGNAINENCESNTEIRHVLIHRDRSDLTDAKRDRHHDLKQINKIENHNGGRPIIAGASNESLRKNTKRQFNRTQDSLKQEIRSLKPSKC